MLKRFLFMQIPFLCTLYTLFNMLCMSCLTNPFFKLTPFKGLIFYFFFFYHPDHLNGKHKKRKPFKYKINLLFIRVFI